MKFSHQHVELLTVDFCVGFVFNLNTLAPLIGFNLDHHMTVLTTPTRLTNEFTFTVGWFGRLIGKDSTPKRDIERVTATVCGACRRAELSLPKENPWPPHTLVTSSFPPKIKPTT